jgi:hypothetical protein
MGGHVRAARARQALAARGKPILGMHKPHDALLRDGMPVTTHLLTGLQGTAGNAAVRQVLTNTTVQARRTTLPGGTISLHGDTTAEYDGGRSHWAPKSIRRAKDCTDCPEDSPCIHAVGTFSIRYHANVTIRMPDMPGGLTPCQQRRVRAFLRDVLGPHEQDHARRFRTYDGTQSHAIDFTGCGRDALQAHLQQIHDDEESARQTAADALSAKIDPFDRPIDLDCES